MPAVVPIRDFGSASANARACGMLATLQDRRGTARVLRRAAQGVAATLTGTPIGSAGPRWRGSMSRPTPYLGPRVLVDRSQSSQRGGSMYPLDAKMSEWYPVDAGAELVRPGRAVRGADRSSSGSPGSSARGPGRRATSPVQPGRSVGTRRRRRGAPAAPPAASARPVAFTPHDLKGQRREVRTFDVVAQIRGGKKKTGAFGLHGSDDARRGRTTQEESAWTSAKRMHSSASLRPSARGSAVIDARAAHGHGGGGRAVFYAAERAALSAAPGGPA